MSEKLSDDPNDDLMCDKDGIGGEGKIDPGMFDRHPNDPMSKRINDYTIEQWRTGIRLQRADETTGEDLFVLICLDEIETLRKERDQAEKAQASSKAALAMISSANRQLGEVKNSLAFLREACLNLLEYRKRNTLNFQLEKLDDYLRDIQTVMDEQENQSLAHDAGKDERNE